MVGVSGRFREKAGPATTASRNVHVVVLLCIWPDPVPDHRTYRERCA